MTGQPITAEEVEWLHVVNAVVLAAEVDRWAGLVASRSPLLMRMGKDALDATRDQPLGGRWAICGAACARPHHR